MATCLDSPQCQGLSQRRLQVLTVIHNFDLKRSDGSTAAQRLFGRPQICLTIWLNTWVIYHNPES